MGIEGLWPLLQSSASAYQLKDFNIEHGFIKAPQAPRALRIGVDASIILSTFHAADRGMQKWKHQLHTSDTTLTQLQQFLCQLSEAGVNCLFLFDGYSQEIPYGSLACCHHSDALLAAYKPGTSEFFVPQLEPLQSNVCLDSKGTEFIPTYSTAILNRKKLTLVGKDVHDVVSVKFSTNFLCSLAGQSIHTDSKPSRRFDVSVVILAWAMKQPGRIHQKLSNGADSEVIVSRTAPLHSEALAGSSRQNQVIELTDSDSEDLSAIIELTDTE
ncbi:hypothetical protein EV360DRAFT_75641 [Lentinula raphanica]|nr:hypothetical protein EV360DRAFT_75641 [Lentinula raphanica]